jgi:trehalose 6-phosphate synthase/phosphatase
MCAEERELRWNELYEYVKTNTAKRWIESFLSATISITKENERCHAKSHDSLSISTLVNKYQKSERRLFLINFEELLSGMVKVKASDSDYEPESSCESTGSDPDSPRDERWVEIISNLAATNKNSVYLYSGSSREELQKLKDQLPNVGLWLVDRSRTLPYANIQIVQSMERMCALPTKWNGFH